MALFSEVLVEEISALVCRHYEQLGAALAKGSIQEDQRQREHQSPLHRDMALLIRVANGEVLRADATNSELDRVEQALSNLLQLLLGNALGAYVAIPDEFWSTDTGILVSRVRWWLSADDLITISNAAALAFGENSQANRMRIARAMDKGLLDWVPDPSVANPQQNRRVLRPQVERLGEQSRLPE